MYYITPFLSYYMILPVRVLSEGAGVVAVSKPPGPYYRRKSLTIEGNPLL